MERKRSLFIQGVRLNAMMDAFIPGASGASLAAAADEKERQLALKIGGRKERNYEKRINDEFSWLLGEPKRSTDFENHNQIDWWQPVKPNSIFPDLSGKLLPVQIKSNPEDVKAFKQREVYVKNFGKKIVVLNFTLKTSKTEFKQKLVRELKRINRIVHQEKLDKLATKKNT